MSAGDEVDKLLSFGHTWLQKVQLVDVTQHEVQSVGSTVDLSDVRIPAGPQCQKKAGNKSLHMKTDGSTNLRFAHIYLIPLTNIRMLTHQFIGS